MPKPKTDFNDIGNLDAVRLQIEAAALVIDQPPQDAAGEANGTTPMHKPSGKNAVREVVLIQGSTIQPEHIIWAWNGWFPLGKLVIVAGQPGTGKTTVMLAILTAITIGGNMPDGTPTDKGSVIFWSGEDGVEDTLVPRLIAAGADMTKVYFVAGKGNVQFDPSQDMPQLAEIAKTIPDLKMIVIDPVVSAVSGDSHKNAEVRKSLQPLVDLGRDTNACIVGISHFNKGGNTSNPGDLVSGSIAFIAVARVVIGVAKLNEPDPEHGHSRIFCRIKSNIGPDEDGIGYDLRMEALAEYEMEASVVSWGSYVKGHSRDLLTQAQAESDEPKKNTRESEAAEFLKKLLSDGKSVAQSTVEEEAEKAGIAEKTLRRAKKTLRVVSKKLFSGWVWRLETDEEIAKRRSCLNFVVPEEAQIISESTRSDSTWPNSFKNNHDHLDRLDHLDSENGSNMANKANMATVICDENMATLENTDEIEDPFADAPNFDLSEAA